VCVCVWGECVCICMYGVERVGLTGGRIWHRDGMGILVWV
jgi:hypothetical protein